MSDIDRSRAIKRLYQAQLGKVREDLPHEKRCEQAKLMMDHKLGPMWREEIDILELEGDADQPGLEEFYSRLEKVSHDEGFGPDRVPPPKDISELKKRDKPDSIIVRLMRMISK